MALTDFYIKQGDTLPAIVIICEDENGNLITDNLSGATVQIHMKKADGTLLITAGAGTVIDNTAKTVGYQWVTGDTATASTSDAPHQLEAQITMSNGRILTIPNDSNINIHVYPQIA